MSKLVFSNIEREAIDFTVEELDSERFNSRAWHVKEVPLTDEIITFVNDALTVEFTTSIKDGGKTINFGYYKLNGGSYDLIDTDKITTAIELNEENNMKRKLSSR